MKYVINKILLLAFILVAVSCTDLRKVSVTSYDIVDFKAHGFRAATVELELGLNNGTGGFEITDVEGEVTKDGTVYGRFEASPIKVNPRTNGKYSTKVKLILDPEISLLEILPLLKKDNLEDIRINGEVRLDPDRGSKKRLKFRNQTIPNIAQYLNL